MRRGISPIVATTILIGLAVIVGIAIYWWAVGFETGGPVQPSEPVEIDASIVNPSTGTVLITNVDVRTLPATTFYVAENPSLKCEVDDLEPGESVNCTFGSYSGQMTIYAKESTEVTLQFP